MAGRRQKFIVYFFERFFSPGVLHIMRPLFTLLLLNIYQCTFCQSTGKPESTSTAVPSALQKISLLSGKHQLQLSLNPADANTWLDYYKWLGNNKELNAAEKQTQRSQAIQTSRQYIGASWQFALMNFIQSGKRNRQFLDAALASAGNKAPVYPYAIQYAIITQNQSMLNEYAQALNEAVPLSPALYEYHYNALMSAGNNAVIYAKGLTDLAPMAILQQVYGIRKDIRFRYYEQAITDTANAYICLSAGKDILQSYPSAVYTGLLVKVSGNDLSKEMLQRPAHFKLDQLNTLQSLEENEKDIYKNYLPSFILLYRSYKKNNDPLAAQWKELIQKTGRLTGNTASLGKILGE